MYWLMINISVIRRTHYRRIIRAHVGEYHIDGVRDFFFFAVDCKRLFAGGISDFACLGYGIEPTVRVSVGTNLIVSAVAVGYGLGRVGLIEIETYGSLGDVFGYDAAFVNGDFAFVAGVVIIFSTFFPSKLPDMNISI